MRSLHNPTSNVLYDLHGKVDRCDLALSTEGNYHMALERHGLKRPTLAQAAATP
jgi:hypothetical protein